MLNHRNADRCLHVSLLTYRFMLHKLEMTLFLRKTKGERESEGREEGIGHHPSASRTGAFLGFQAQGPLTETASVEARTRMDRELSLQCREQGSEPPLRQLIIIISFL